MSFIVPLMAFGALAAIIPLIIHLRNRSRFQVVHWGAMHLLDSVLRINRRRIRIEQLILLLVRMAIPAAIALFMAKPVLTGWRALPGDVKRSVVIALDNSYSMEAGGGDQSGFSKARRSISEIVNGLKRGSDVAVVTMAGAEPTLEKPTVDLNTLRLRIRDLAGGYGKADAADALDAALTRFKDMNHADRELVILSDFQRVSWADQGAELQRIANQIQSMEVKPRVTLMPIGGDQRENVSVKSLTFSRFIVGANQKVQARATIQNHGEKAYSGLRVHLRADGVERETSEIALGPGEQAQVMFSHAFDSPGSHYLEVAVDADPLAADNAMLAAIPVWDQIPVVLVNGEPSREPLRGETDYLDIALQPFTAAARKLADLIRTRTVEVAQFDARALTDVRVVVLANPGSLNPQQVLLLDEFVRSGGGLLFFPGSRLDLGWYNNAIAGSGNGLIPLRLRGPAGSLSEREKQTTVAGGHFDHEALALFNLPDNGTIAGAEVWMWYALDDPAALRAADEQFTVLARLVNGDPFLIERKLGEGRVIICSTACDADWNNLPMRPSYVPLIQQLVTYLASTVYPPRNVQVGNELGLFLPAAKAGARLTVALPTSALREAQAVGKGARAIMTFTETQRPGLYTVSGDGVGPIHFVANTSRDESVLDSLTEAEITQAARTLGADVVKSTADYASLQSERHHGREIWRPLFFAALGLVFLELFLEQLFARRKA